MTDWNETIQKMFASDRKAIPAEALRAFYEVTEVTREGSIRNIDAGLRAFMTVMADRSTRPAEPAGRAGCEDCGRPYGDEHGFPDLVVPHDVWEVIMPGRDGAGLLCPSCMCGRAHKAGVERRAVFTSGPFVASEAEQNAVMRPAETADGCGFSGPVHDAEMCPVCHPKAWRPAEPAPEVDVGEEADDLTAAFMAGFARGKDATKAEADELRRDRDVAVRVAVEDDHLFWFLYVLNACGKHGASCSDHPWEWVGAFCGDFEPTDTFNRAVKLKLAGWSHNSDTDEARTWITDAGKKWLANRARLRADQPATGEGNADEART